MLVKKNIFTIFLFFVCYVLMAQRREGSSFVHHFAPKEYNAHNQSWCILQDKRGIIYIGNGDGIMEYDGVSFRIISPPNKSAVRSIALDSNNRVWVGVNAEFGFLAPDSAGNLKYYSLINQLDEKSKSFQDVWGTTVFNNAVYFRTYVHLIRFKNGKLDKIWNTSLDKSISAEFIFNNELYFRQKKVGLVKLDTKTDSLVVASDSKFFIENSFRFAIELDSEKVLLNAGNTLQFYYPKENKIIPFETDYERFLEKERLYSGMLLPNKNILVGTSSKGFVIFSQEGKTLQVINAKTGLHSESVYGTCVDFENSLWCVTNNEVTRTEVLSPLTLWNEGSDFWGAIESIIRFQGKIYFTTHMGIFCIENNLADIENFGRIKQIGDLKTQCWSIIDFQEPNDTSKHHLLVGTSSFLCEIKNDKIEIIKNNSGFVAFELFISRKNPSRIVMGTGKGVASVRFENGKFVDEGNWGGNLEYDVRGIAEDEYGEFWFGTFRGGIYRYLPSEKDITQPQRVKLYTTKDGIPSLKNTLIFYFQNRLIFGCEKGLSRFDRVSGKFIPDETFGKMFADGSNDVFWCIEGNDKRVWISGLNKRTGTMCVAIPDKDGKFTIDSRPFRTIPEMMFLGFRVESDRKIVWVGGSDALYKLDESIKTDYSVVPQVHIRKVTIGQDSVVFGGTFFEFADNQRKIVDFQTDFLKPKIKYAFNSVTFDFSSTSYKSEKDNEFQYYLENFDKTWSNWVKNPQKSYTNLSEGKYIFHLKTRNIYGVESKELTYEFRILPPWYRTIFAYICYFLMLGGIFYVGIRLYTKRLKQKNKELEQIVEERTAEIREQNQQLSQYNAEIFQQKEEIQAQAEQLSRINTELEKLSIVASETDNAVMIMDKDTNFEWINAGFSRLYGFTFEQFVRGKGKNLLEYTSFELIHEILRKCISEKKSVMYESSITKNTGEKFWVQTTLTPILDMNNEIYKFVAIDSDITRIKRAEEEIRQQNEEILVQKEMLETQNEEIMVQKEILQSQNNAISEQRDQIRFQHQQIQQSIQYSLTIQKAILPSISSLNLLFENFIIYKPKDIVSGDFYWLNVIENYIFIAAIDCTGHGVPGAFMSLIGNRLLNDIVNLQNEFSPAKILELLHLGILKTLRQYETDNNDGMDVCFCRIKYLENQEVEVIFDGAKRPLIYFDKEKNVIETVKGSRKTIGGTHAKANTQVFEDKAITLKKESILYLSTDGFTDQCNKERKRFGTEKLVEILQNHFHLSLYEQKIILEKSLAAHQQNEMQRDDITVIGIKL